MDKRAGRSAAIVKLAWEAGIPPPPSHLVESKIWAVNTVKIFEE
jgi:hypothetical protein